ncbi:SDR family oxidoreductase [Streptomyces sp. NPDC060194]|uniref:SDR family oxidoreductase n=1 Tax=Streptomyces sp. NPDC060194 TaxID=3347069 RepID=UPI00366366E2
MSGTVPVSADAPRERFVAADGVELCVVEYGEPAPGRPTVVLLHGYPDSKEVWGRVAPRLAGGGRRHVVLYDVRGHGRSGAPRPLRGGFTLRKLTDDFLAVADAVSPDRPVHLVGHDWGSVQGWEFATAPRTRGRIASFTSLSGPSLDHFGHWIERRARRPSPRAVGQLLGQGAKSWYVYALHTPVLPEAAWRGPLGRHWPALLRRVERVPGGDGYPTDSLRQDAAHGTWLYRDNVRTRLRTPREDAFAHVPVLLVTPTDDPFLSPRLHDDLDRWVPDLERRTLPAKHWVPRTHPDQLSRMIADFVDARDAGTGEERSVVRHTARGPYADRFGGRLVLVTGAASGIGRATALAFAAAGARVVVVDRNAEGARRTAELALSAGASGAWAETVDVGDEQAMEKLAERTERDHGVVDVLVNNAGVAVAGPFLDTSTEEWASLLDVNLWGVIHGCRIFGRRMAARGEGGHIVNVSSLAGYQPSAVLPAYSTSKAAVLMLSECLRAELAPLGIGVSAVCPGFVSTGIVDGARFAGAGLEEELRRRERSSCLLRRRKYPPERVASAILRAVDGDRAVVPVTWEARAGLMLGRVLPGARRAIARLMRP